MKTNTSLLVLFVFFIFFSCKKKENKGADDFVDLKVNLYDHYTTKPLGNIPVNLFFCKQHALSIGPSCEGLEKSLTNSDGDIVFANLNAQPGEKGFIGSQYYSAQIEQTQNYAGSIKLEFGEDNSLSLGLYPLMNRKVAIHYNFDIDRTTVGCLSNMHASNQVDSLNSKNFIVQVVPDQENYISFYFYKKGQLIKDTTFTMKPQPGDTSTVILNL